jgi:hypothetical protein
MKNLNQILALRRKYVKRESRFPFNKTQQWVKLRLIKFLPRLLNLVLDSISGIKGRLIVANNFIQFIFRMLNHHGPTYTVKWMKAVTVAFQKWLGGDKLKSLRVIEPNLPLPRLINGCPAIINRQDRLLMKRGDIRIMRFWHSLFSIYRVLEIPGKLKLETITSPFSGKKEELERVVQAARSYPFPKNLKTLALSCNLAPTTFHASGKASPSSVNSALGWLSDVYLLSTHEEGKVVFPTLLGYLQTISSKWNTTAFMSKIREAASIIETCLDKPEYLNFKKSMVTPFGQFAIKEEPAGKIRVFALVDSVTQSILKPLHLALFSVLRELPNDGTFDQDASVKRCAEKAQKYGCAFSFDLSAATDRLPIDLTGAIIENLFSIEHLSQAWQWVMVDRNFSFNQKTADKLEIPRNSVFRYAVGQPMGALSSWAGLAITHHWVMQFCAQELRGYPSSHIWEDRYEVLGDDIVIFDRALAFRYTALMADLGLEINFSKSILSFNRPVLEFAKRTIVDGQLASGITLSQVASSDLLSARVNNVYAWIARGYLKKISTIQFCLRGFTHRQSDYIKWCSQVASFSMLGQTNVEQNILIRSLVDPRKGDLWDMETEEFRVPSRTLVMMARDLITKGETDLCLSNDEARVEWLNDADHSIVAGILQVAMTKVRDLANHYIDTQNEWAMQLVSSSFPRDQLPKVEGWLGSVLTDNRRSQDIDPYELDDVITNRLVYHAKTLKVELKEAYELLDKVDALVYLYKAPSKSSQDAYERLDRPLLRDFTRPFFMKGPQYWNSISPGQV